VSSGTVLLSTDHGALTVVDDHGDGTYTATLTATSPGTATITGTLAGTDITDEETVVVTVGAASVGTTTITAASGSITTDGSTLVTVQLKDANGNNLGVSSGTVLLSTDHEIGRASCRERVWTSVGAVSATRKGTATITGTAAGTEIEEG